MTMAEDDIRELFSLGISLEPVLHYAGVDHLCLDIRTAESISGQQVDTVAIVFDSKVGKDRRLPRIHLIKYMPPRFLCERPMASVTGYSNHAVFEGNLRQSVRMGFQKVKQIIGYKAIADFERF